MNDFDYCWDSGRILTRGRLDEMTRKIMEFDTRRGIGERLRDTFYRIIDYVRGRR